MQSASYLGSASRPIREQPEWPESCGMILRLINPPAPPRLGPIQGRESMPALLGPTRIIRGTAVVVILALLLAPVLHSYHLISEPHIFCPIHGHLESTESTGTGDSVPAERGDHEDEDLSCLLAASSAYADGPETCFSLVDALPDAGTAGEHASSVILVLDVTASAPKHSPPAWATIS